MNATIYLVRITGDIQYLYVGQTTQDLSKRLAGHCATARAWARGALDCDMSGGLADAILRFGASSARIEPLWKIERQHASKAEAAAVVSFATYNTIQGLNIMPPPHCGHIVGGMTIVAGTGVRAARCRRWWPAGRRWPWGGHLWARKDFA